MKTDEIKIHHKKKIRNAIYNPEAALKNAVSSGGITEIYYIISSPCKILPYSLQVYPHTEMLQGILLKDLPATDKCKYVDGKNMIPKDR